MSCLLAIGFQALELEPDLLHEIAAARFEAVERITDADGRELGLAAKRIAPKTRWFIAVDAGGSADFEIAYELGAELQVRLGRVIHFFQTNSHASTLEVFLYDLGTHELRVADEVTATEIEEALHSLYATGAPMCSVYHVFRRN